ncbi:MAG: hypothetical protein V2I45_05865, partial [Halieaceae bacterium]|nr:hypothetical protein [Halieaceae bacterium]
VYTAGDNRNGQNFFWRLASNPEDLQSVQYEGRGRSYLRLRDNADWQGTITEIGLVFYDDGGSLSIGEMALMPDSLPSRLRQAFTEWGQMMPWRQKSSNWLPAGAHNALLPLPLFVSGWLIIALLLLKISRRKLAAGHSHATVVALCLLAWLVLDSRWLLNRSLNTNTTLAAYSLGSSDVLHYSGDKAVKQTAERAVGEGESAAPLLITADEDRLSFQMLRAKYHALPMPAYVHEGKRRALPRIISSMDLLVLKQPYRDPAAPVTRAAEWQEFLQSNGAIHRTAWESDSGFLLTPDREYIDRGLGESP